MAQQQVLYRASSDVIAQAIDAEVVLLDPESETYFGLDAIGTRIWQLLSEQRSFEELVAELVTQYDAREEQIREEAAVFLEQLCAEGLVTRVNP